MSMDWHSVNGKMDLDEPIGTSTPFQSNRRWSRFQKKRLFRMGLMAVEGQCENHTKIKTSYAVRFVSLQFFGVALFAADDQIESSK